ncbi:MAG: hypothetical protein O6940_02550 [Ignavibacteria bacterium]|nr:hypothetical protein [Ignavibacteria bacterium]
MIKILELCLLSLIHILFIIPTKQIENIEESPIGNFEGIIIDRLDMLLTNQSSIREVIVFPQMSPEG